MPSYIIRTMAADGHLCLLTAANGYPNNSAAIDAARKFARGNQTAEVWCDEQCIYKDQPSAEGKLLRFPSKKIVQLTT
jgi:hypothetical protein